MSPAVDTSPVLPELADHTIDPLPLRGTRIGVIVAALACAAVQLVANDSGDTYVMAALAGTVMTFYALRSSVLHVAPLSSLALIGFGLLTFWLPLVATTFEGKALTFELLRPDLTFGFSLIVFAVLIFTHAFYLHSATLQGLRAAVSNRLLLPIRIFDVPSPVQLFAIGVVGLTAMFAVSFGFEAKQGEEAGNIVLKALEGLFPLAYAPFVTLLYPLTNSPAIRPRTVAIPLLMFSLGLLVASSARNSRSAAVLGFASIGVGILLAGWLGNLPAHVFRARNIVLVVLAGIVFGAVGERMATAMLIVRSEHHDASPLEYVPLTLSTFLDGDAIVTFDSINQELHANQRIYSWNEYYLDNLFLARLGNPRFTDNALTIVSQLDSSALAEIRHQETLLIAAILPQPILRAFSIPIDKESIRGSMGSFLYYLMTSNPDHRGTFRTGSLIASAWGCGSWAFPLLIALLAIIYFALIDSFSVRRTHLGTTTVAPIAILALYSIAVVFTSAALGKESISAFVTLLIRDLPEQTVLYAAAYWLVRNVVPK